MGREHGARAAPCLIVTTGSQRCALPIEDVIETMRPLAMSTLPDMPRGMMGVSVVRGEATVVLDLSALLDERRGDAGLWVRVRARRPTVIAAHVVGIDELDRSELEAGRALVAGSRTPWIASIVANGVSSTVVLDVARTYDATAEGHGPRVAA